MTDPPKRKRAPGAGRKPTHGVTKIDGNIALTPDVRAFLKEAGQVSGKRSKRLYASGERLMRG